MIVDVEGYYLPNTADAADYFAPSGPDRILDTRSGLNTGGKTTALANAGTLSVPIRGVQGISGNIDVPASAKVTAVMLSITAVSPTVSGYLAAFPEGVARPVGSIANYTVGSQSNVTASAVVKVGSSGRISVYANGSTHVIVDVQGYFAETPPAAPPTPTLSSSTFTSNGWAGSGTTGTVTATASAPSGDPAVDHYDWDLDDPSLATPNRVNVSANTAGSLALSGVNAPKDGWHTLYVRSGNTAGNTSAVAAYTFGVGVAITGPTEGTRSTRYVRLNGKAPSSYGSVTWNYRRTATDTWTVIPSAHVTKAGTALTGWPVATTTAGATTTAPELVWDAKTTLGADTSVLVQACYAPAGGGTVTCSADSAAPTVTLDQLDAGNADATTSLAGGTVDLLTGNFATSETDVSVSAPGSDLSVTRSFNSLDPTRTANQATGTASVFGPGWTTGLPVGSADSDWTGLSDRGSTIAVVDSDGAALTFAKQSGGGYKPTGDDADSGLTLTAGTAGTYGPTSYTVADLDGNATTFAPKGTLHRQPHPGRGTPLSGVAGDPAGQRPDHHLQLRHHGRPTQILAPVPAGSTCTSTTPGSGTSTGGCKGLYLAYGTSGNASGRLIAVTFRTTNPAGAELDIDVVCYAYDADTRLAAVWDPRDGTAGTGTHPVTCAGQVRPTTYTYDSAGRIATITPPGLAAWTLGYDASGRLSTVARTHNSANGGGTETSQVVYGVAATADGTHPQYRPDLSGTAIEAWGQAEAPVTGTAVFGPGHAASSTDLRGAEVSYLNAEGRTVNTADYSAPAGWTPQRAGTSTPPTTTPAATWSGR